MFNERNIPKFISYLPPIGIIFITILFTFIIIQSDYKKLTYESDKIRQSHIKEEKETLQSKITNIIKYIDYLEKTNDTNSIDIDKIKRSVITYTKDVISKNSDNIFILDNKKNIQYNPKLKNNVNALNQIDESKLLMTHKFISKASKSKDGTFVSYQWARQNERSLKEKTVFVYYLAKWNWILATGTYLNDIDNEIAEKTYYLKQELNENVSYTILISILLTVITLFISFFFSKSVNTIFIRYKKEAIQKEKKLKKLNRSLKKLANEEIRKRSLKEEELAFVYKEPLTGLQNRLQLSENIQKENNSKLAILNIDRFIDINNFYSAQIADELLKEIALFLVEIFRKKEGIEIFKLPVDEYAIYTNSEIISDFEFTNMCKLVIKLIEKKPFSIKENDIIVSITAGISLTDENTFINADTALKIAKGKRKSLFIYDKNDNIEKNFQNNIKWTKILKDAIKNHQITILKQPIIKNSDKENRKYECLIRIKQEDGTYITPNYFLDIAKKIKLYPQLTKIVVSQSFKHFSKCTCKKRCEFSINLTLDDITNEDTVRYITHKLEKYNVAKQVIFEIVESEGIDNFEEVSLFIKTMKEYGCKIAIDDFGTGYSNFEYLMKLNVDFIKIDGSFIKNIDKNPQSELISSLIIDFARQQGISTIAEFVHSKEVLNKVKEMGIDYSQGFYLGEPEKL